VDVVSWLFEDANVKMKPAAESMLYDPRVEEPLSGAVARCDRIVRAASAITRRAGRMNAIEPDSPKPMRSTCRSLTMRPSAVTRRFNNAASPTIRQVFSASRVLTRLKHIQGDRFDE